MTNVDNRHFGYTAWNHRWLQVTSLYCVYNPKDNSSTGSRGLYRQMAEQLWVGLALASITCTFYLFLCIVIKSQEYLELLQRCSCWLYWLMNYPQSPPFCQRWRGNGSKSYCCETRGNLTHLGLLECLCERTKVNRSQENVQCNDTKLSEVCQQSHNGAAMDTTNATPTPVLHPALRFIWRL